MTYEFEFDRRLRESIPARCHDAARTAQVPPGLQHLGPAPIVYVITTLGPVNDRAILVPAELGWRARMPNGQRWT